MRKFFLLYDVVSFDFYMDNLMSNVQYSVNIIKGEDTSYLIGPFLTPRDTINWIYKQIGSLNTVYPSVDLEKTHWEYEETNDMLTTKVIFNVDIKLGDYRFVVIEMADPSISSVHPECDGFGVGTWDKNFF
jgi:hypothetical protein